MTVPQQEFSEDQLAILKVITADFDSYLARDKETWIQQWVPDHRFHSIMECGPLQIAEGFESFRDNIFEAMEAEPTPFDVPYTRENVKIIVKGDVAWAIFDEMVGETGNPFAPPILTHNVRVLIREDGRWRIAFHGCWSVRQRDVQTPTIEVDAACKVVWMNGAAQKALQGFGGLSVSNGQLRSAKPAFNGDLHDKIARAHKLTGFAAYNLAAAQGGGTVNLHVDLGEDPEGQPLLCWVKVSDGRVFVLFDAAPDLGNQIAVAQIIFGLSDAQAQAVAGIAAGLDIPKIAQGMGVSANTVKTHIKRAYEKLDVGSQVDLLRKLVGLGV